MKITLSETLINNLMSQSPETAMKVIATCRELIKLDNDAIEQYQLDPDAPQPLHDIINDMKKRAALARRRRQRREAKANANIANPTEPKATPTSTNQKISISPTHLEAINLLFSNSTTFSDSQMEVMHQFIQFIIGRLTTPPSTPTHRPRKKKAAKPQPQKTPTPAHNTYRRAPISHILKKRA